MGVTPFPHGISSFGVPVTPESSDGLVAGNVMFVGKSASSKWIAGADNPYYGPMDAPFASIDYAIGQCTANQGDIIYVLPGHTETISAAGGITADVAGVSIIGLGYGTFRPKITWSAAASSCLITAANVKIKNILTTISIDEVVSMFASSASDTTLDMVNFTPYGALGVTGQAIQFLLTTAAAANLTLKNCTHLQATAAAADQKWIQLVGVDNPRILNNRIDILAKAATGSIALSGSTACTNVEVVGNRIIWRGATITSVINFVTGSTGVIAYNGVGSGIAGTVTANITGDGCYFFENYSIDAVNASGILTPAAGTYA